MNTNDNNIIKTSDKLSLIYRTDPFGFPLHAADEEIYKKSMAVAEPDTQVANPENMMDIAPSNEATDSSDQAITDKAIQEIS